MPGIHFAEARARIALADVLDLLGFVPCESSGDQVRGPCPVHHSISPSSRSFSANLKRHIYRCFKCGSCGNQLDLYASATRLSLFEATVALCEQLHRDVPWMLNGTPLGPRSTDRYAPQPPSGASQAGELVRSLSMVKRIAPQPLRWSPLARKSGTLSDRNRQTEASRPTKAFRVSSCPSDRTSERLRMFDLRKA